MMNLQVVVTSEKMKSEGDTVSYHCLRWMMMITMMMTESASWRL